MAFAYRLARAALVAATSPENPPVIADPAARSRYLALDGLRGIAALIIVLHHYTMYAALPSPRGSAGVVDLFFALSGFVLMAAYGDRFDRGLRFTGFLGARIARLAPMYLIGLGLGLVAAVIESLRQTAHAPGLTAIAEALALNLFGLPYLNHHAWPFGEARVPGPVFPLNDPAWSMFFQLFANAVFAVMLITFARLRLSRPAPVLTAIAGGGLAALLLSLTLVGDFGAGWGTANFALGFPRAIGWFFAGTVLYLWQRRMPAVPPALVLGLVAALVLLWCVAGGRGRWLTLFVLTPAVLLTLPRLAVPPRWQALCAAAGALSYPLYITHFPIYRLLAEVGALRALPPLVTLAVELAVALVIAAALTRLDRHWQQARRARRPRLVPTAETSTTAAAGS